MANEINFPVPQYYSDFSASLIEAGKNVVGQDFYNMSLGANYNIAHGQQKIPMTFIGETLNSSIKNLYYRVYDVINPNINERYWTLSAKSFQSVGSIDISISGSFSVSPSGSLMNITPGDNQIIFQNSFNMEIDRFQAEDIMITLTALSSSTDPLVARIRNISMFDAPRYQLNPIEQGCEQAVDYTTNKAGKPIFSSPSDENASIAGIVKSLNYFSSSHVSIVEPPKARSGKCLWSYFRAYKTNVNNPYFRTTNAMYSSTNVANVKTNAFSSIGMSKPFVFATQTSLNQTSSLCRAYFYSAVQTSGDIGKFEITTSLGVYSKTISNTTPGWDSLDFYLETENVESELGGIPRILNDLTGNLDINLTKSTTTGTGIFNVWSIQIVEI